MGYRSMGSCLLSSSVLVECWVVVVGGSSCFWVPLVDCPGLTSAWRASSFSLRRDPCCGPGWAFRTGSSVWQHRQVAISGGQPTSGRSNPVPRFWLDPFQDGAIYSNFPQSERGGGVRPAAGTQCGRGLLALRSFLASGGPRDYRVIAGDATQSLGISRRLTLLVGTLALASRLFVWPAHCPLKRQSSEPHHVTALALPNAV